MKFNLLIPIVIACLFFGYYSGFRNGRRHGFFDGRKGGLELCDTKIKYFIKRCKTNRSKQCQDK